MVAREQLCYLLEQAELANVTLQVLPLDSGAHSGMNGAFTLLEFPDPSDPGVLYVEYPTGSLHVEKDTEVAAGRLAFDALHSEALDVIESKSLIRNLSEKL
ncbi:hypothetical protein JOF55_002266 [Haloactinomyces albus]|uniref:DUF5753 domain-containing protein n=1 Tax=Haloactinomyces albus TaxID=1352928 RepID=A0AAE3ZDV9_9ACTN|nr:hypothetical protein [Haloactinomyces albus]